MNADLTGSGSTSLDEMLENVYYSLHVGHSSMISAKYLRYSKVAGYCYTKNHFVIFIKGPCYPMLATCKIKNCNDSWLDKYFFKNYIGMN